MSRIAPDQRDGYPPAHAWMFEHYLDRFGILKNQPITPANFKILKHHALVSMQWDKLNPEKLVFIATILDDRDQAVNALTLAAKKDPKFNIALVEFIQQRNLEKYKLVAQTAIEKGIKHLQTAVARDPDDQKASLLLSEALLLNGDFAGAERQLLGNSALPSSPELRKQLSEVYRRQFVSTIQRVNGAWTGNMELLDRAFRADPSNERVYDQVAQIVYLTGKALDGELMQEFQRLLAEGKVSPIAHVILSKYYLTRQNYAKAIPHLEVVVKRLPNATECLNNLAYCLSAVQPERRSEAIEYIDRAINLATQQNTLVPDFYDTKGTILVAMGRPKEAIADFEAAIELFTQVGRLPNPDFHDRLSNAYKLSGDDAMAEQHLKVAADLRKKIAELQAQQQAQQLVAQRPDEGAPPAPQAERDSR